MKTAMLALCGAIALGVCAPAQAHITLEQQQAAVGAVYKAVMRVGHGCKGSPTVAVRVRIPDGVIGVKPMPKPGWTLTTKIEPYAQPAKLFEHTLTEGVREIAWTGGNLPDDWYEEFVFRGKLPDGPAGTTVWFPVVQECAQGVHRWIEIPAAGKSPGDYPEPAPGVTLMPRN